MSSKLIVIGVACILLAGTFTGMVAITNEGKEQRGVAVIFDDSEPIPKKVAKNIHTIISVNYPHSEIIPVSNVKRLKEEIDQERLISVYFFHGGTEGMRIGGEKISWEKLGRLLKRSDTRWHIVEACQSINLDDLPNVHGINEGVDIELAKIDALNHVSEMLRKCYQPEELCAAEAIREEFNQYVTENLVEIITRAFEPVETLDGDCFKEFPLNITANGVWGWLIKKALWALGTIEGGTFFNIDETIKEKPKLQIKKCVDEGWEHGVNFLHEKLGLGNDSDESMQFPFDIELPIKINYDTIEEIVAIYETYKAFEEIVDIVTNLKDILDDWPPRTCDDIQGEINEIVNALGGLEEEINNVLRKLDLTEGDIEVLDDIKRELEDLKSEIEDLCNRTEQGSETVYNLVGKLEKLREDPLKYLLGESDGLNLFLSSIERNLLNVEGINKIEQIVKAAGYELDIFLKPKITAGIKLRDFTWPDSVNALKETVKFLGGSFGIETGFSLFIPLAKIIDYIIPGTGTAIKNVMDFLGIKAGVEFILSVIIGYDYNAETQYSVYNFTFLFNLNVLIDGKMGIGQILGRLIGVNIPFDFIKLLFKVKAGSGIGARTFIAPTALKFQVGIPYLFLIDLGIKILFWSFSWGKKVEGIKWFPNSWQNSTDTDNANFDLDLDGLWDKLEVNMSLNTNASDPDGDGPKPCVGWDTDGDGLGDGNEVNEFFTNPNANDSDGDGLLDKQELTYWYNETGHDPFVDYDTDRLLCLLDADSDNDGLKDGGPRVLGDNTTEMPGEATYGTDPSLPDTDFDGLLDSEEVEYVELHWIVAFPDGDPTECVPTGYVNRNAIELLERGMVFRPWIQNFYLLPDSPEFDDIRRDLSELVLYEGPLYGAIVRDTEQHAPGIGWIVDFVKDWEVQVEYERWFNLADYFDEPFYVFFNVTDPIKEDTDGDGLIDGFERWYFEEGRNQTYGFPNVTNGGAYLDFDGDGDLNIVDWDSDNDKLSDGEEFQYGTDPLDIDTDGDYDRNNNGMIELEEIPWNKYEGEWGWIDWCADLSDYGEIKGQQRDNKGQPWPGYEEWSNPQCPYPDPTTTNPAKADSDDDGYFDWQEWEKGSCPVEEDSDGDGLMNDGEICSNCSDSDTDDDRLQDGFETRYFNRERRRKFRTVENGSACDDFDGDGKPNINDFDSDNDGLGDGFEFLYNIDPLDNDTDDDGLNDREEFRSKFFPIIWLVPWTDPLNPDTDGDRLLDGEEVSIGSDPLKEDTDDDGLIDSYEVFNHTKKLLFVGEITYRTDPCNPDTDNDSISDGDEIRGWHWAINRNVTDGNFSSDIWWERGVKFKWEKYHWDRERIYDFPDPYRARFETNPADNDTDGDGLTDGKEKEMVLSPLTNDTDVDGIPDPEEIELIKVLAGGDGKDWRKFDTWHYLDFDHDGLTDKEEMEIDKNLNDTDIWKLLTNSDADGDGLTDWEEVRVSVSLVTMETDRLVNRTNPISNFQRNWTKIKRDYYEKNIEKIREIYSIPWCGWECFEILWPMLNSTGVITPQDWQKEMEEGDLLVDVKNFSTGNYTDPLDNDTDDDGLNDWEEVRKYGTNPFDNDTDDDGLKDDEETLIYYTNPLVTDTDSDGPFHGWTDGKERDKWIKWYEQWALPIDDATLSRYLNNPDVDGDGIVDGVEFMNYTIELPFGLKIPHNPLEPNQISRIFLLHWYPDGYFTDYDGDGLSDFREYYSPAPNYTQITKADLNASFNYSESIFHFINHTSYCIDDTDGDGYSDGVDPDPLNKSVPMPKWLIYDVFPGITTIDAIDEMDTQITINATKYMEVILREYPEIPTFIKLPDDVIEIGKYIDVIVEDPDSIVWPVNIKKYYTQADLDAALITENKVQGLYYSNGTAWKLYNETMVNTNDVTLNGREYAGYAQAYAWSGQLSPKVIGGRPSMITINVPREGYLHIFGREILPTIYGNTVIIGKITVGVDAYSVHNMEKVEFYVDDELRFTDYEAPYEWLWDEAVFFRHKIKVIAYDKVGNRASAEIRVCIFNI